MAPSSVGEARRGRAAASHARAAQAADVNTMLKAASEEGVCVHSEITSTRLLARHKRKSSRLLIKYASSSEARDTDRETRE